MRRVQLYRAVRRASTQLIEYACILRSMLRAWECPVSKHNCEAAACMLRCMQRRRGIQVRCLLACVFDTNFVSFQPSSIVRTQMRCSRNVFALVRNFACMHIYMVHTYKPRSACVRVDDPMGDGQLHYVPGSRPAKILMYEHAMSDWVVVCMLGHRKLPSEV